MTTIPIRLLMRPFALFGLVLALLVFAGNVSAQDMITYPDIPVYGMTSGINATVDIYLPASAGNLLEDPALRRFDVVNLPTVFFVPALNPQAMAPYAADLTGQGYAVVALDYRVQYASADALCALSWVHTFASIYGLDENRIVAFGYSDGGQLAALLGAMGGQFQTISGGPSAQPLAVVSTAPVTQAAYCPWPVPDAPMIEGVATYDADLGTPVALVDRVFQLTTLPPADTSRAQLIAAFNEFATLPVTEWADVRLPEPEAGYVSLSDQVRSTLVVESPNPNWVRNIAVTLPTYWLDGNEPRHLLMVGDGAAEAVRADNLAYDNLLRELGVPVRWAQMSGCDHDPCALIGNMEPLNMFLAEVFTGS